MPRGHSRTIKSRICREANWACLLTCLRPRDVAGLMTVLRVVGTATIVQAMASVGGGGEYSNRNAVQHIRGV
jgi:hypothetical protein